MREVVGWNEVAILFLTYVIHSHYRVFDFCYMIYVYVIKFKLKFNLASKQSSLQLLPSTEWPPNNGEHITKEHPDACPVAPRSRSWRCLHVSLLGIQAAGSRAHLVAVSHGCFTGNLSNGQGMWRGWRVSQLASRKGCSPAAGGGIVLWSWSASRWRACPGLLWTHEYSAMFVQVHAHRTFCFAFKTA